MKTAVFQIQPIFCMKNLITIDSFIILFNVDLKTTLIRFIKGQNNGQQ